MLFWLACAMIPWPEALRPPRGAAPMRPGAPPTAPTAVQCASSTDVDDTTRQNDVVLPDVLTPEPHRRRLGVRRAHARRAFRLSGLPDHGPDPVRRPGTAPGSRPVRVGTPRSCPPVAPGGAGTRRRRPGHGPVASTDDRPRVEPRGHRPDRRPTFRARRLSAPDVDRPTSPVTASVATVARPSPSIRNRRHGKAVTATNGPDVRGTDSVR